MEIKIKSKFIKIGENVKQGDILTILDEGEFVQKEYKGQKKTGLQFTVENPEGEEKICNFNVTSQRNLIGAWGKESKNWKGKQVKCHVITQLIGGKPTKILVLTPTDWPEAFKDETDIPIIEEGSGTGGDADEIDPKSIPF